MTVNECVFNRAPVNGTCFNKEDLQILAEHNNTPVADIKQIKQKLNCDTDSCVLANTPNLDDETKDKIDNHNLKPFTKDYSGKYWLNNTELDSCMIQLRNLYPGFGFGFIHMVDLVMFPPQNKGILDFEVFPVTDIDFSKEFGKTVNKIQRTCSDKISTLNNVPLTSYGAVFNTDTSDGGGQHWYAIYISTDQRDINNKMKIVIELFNSSGNDIDNDNFNQFWIKTALKIGKDLNVECEFKKVSNVKHQDNSTGNCGAYSVFYIFSRLNNVDPNEFNQPTEILKDSTMESFRRYIFRNQNQIL